MTAGGEQSCANALVLVYRKRKWATPQQEESASEVCSELGPEHSLPVRKAQTKEVTNELGSLALKLERRDSEEGGVDRAGDIAFESEVLAENRSFVLNS